MSNHKSKMDKPLIIFFILSFVLAWLFSAIAIAQNYGYLAGELALEPFLIIGAWTPNIAAFITLAVVIRQKGAVLRLILGWAKWKVGFKWYLAALSPLFISFITIFIYRLVFAVDVTTETISSPAIFAGLLLIVIVTGATGEQLGWRGFALPRLQMHINALTASIVLGLIWSAWHIPLWFAGIGMESFPFWAYTTIGVAFSIVITWACNSSKGSMLIASLGHLSLNMAINIIDDIAIPAFAIIFIIFAVVITLINSPQKLSKVDRLPIDENNYMWSV